MPIYEYVCDECGEHYERIVMKQDTIISCPKCRRSGPGACVCQSTNMFVMSAGEHYERIVMGRHDHLVPEMRERKAHHPAFGFCRPCEWA